jgi:hypothetical protein
MALPHASCHDLPRSCDEPKGGRNDVTDKPINIFPWLDLVEPVTIGGVRFGALAVHEDLLERWAFDRASRMVETFAGPTGEWHDDEFTVRRVASPCLAVSASPATPLDPQSEATRLDLASHVLGAVALRDNPAWSLDIVQPFPMTIQSGWAANCPVSLPNPDGSVTVSGLNTFVVVRPPWIAGPSTYADRQILHSLKENRL